MAPEIIGEKRRMYKGVNANVDFYSGLVYSMLDLPPACGYVLSVRSRNCWA